MLTETGQRFRQEQFRKSLTVHPEVCRTLTAARYLLAKPVKRGEPMTPDLILDLHKLAYKEDNMWHTYWIISMAFHGLFRWCDLACMKISDVSLAGNVVVFHIPCSKTDQVGQGSQLSLTEDPSSPSSFGHI